MKSGSRSRGATRKETIEVLKPVQDRTVGNRKVAPKADTWKGKKAIKGPNKPKRPPSAFFVFMEDFRVTFIKENPHVKAVSVVGKAGGERWKSMSKAEKAPFEDKAVMRMVEYEKLMNAYNKKQESSADEADDGSEKSAFEVHDDEESVQEVDDDDERPSKKSMTFESEGCEGRVSTLPMEQKVAKAKGTSTASGSTTMSVEKEYFGNYLTTISESLASLAESKAKITESRSVIADMKVLGASTCHMSPTARAVHEKLVAQIAVRRGLQF